MVSICVNCGSEKEMPWESCSECAFQPHLDSDDFLRSFFVSDLYVPDNPGTKINDISSRLREYSNAIKNGIDNQIDERQKKTLQCLVENPLTLSNFDLAVYLIRAFYPAALFLLALFVLLLIIKQF